MDVIEASEVRYLASHRERFISLFFNQGAMNLERNQEATVSRLQPNKVARLSSTPSYYLRNILERLQLEYQTLERKCLINPASSTCSREGIEDTFSSGALLLKGFPI